MLIYAENSVGALVWMEIQFSILFFANFHHLDLSILPSFPINYRHLRCEVVVLVKEETRFICGKLASSSAGT